jgi:hypothetical protein
VSAKTDYFLVIAPWVRSSEVVLPPKIDFTDERDIETIVSVGLLPKEIVLERQ